jgi:signal transduction histidine kinase
MVAVLLLYAALTSNTLDARETAHRFTSLFDRPVTPAADPLRSQYAEQIAAATRQEERARLARELHDAVKQQLFVIQTSTATAQARFDADASGARAALERVRTAARQAITEMEAMLRQLQAAPLGHAGFVSALTAETDALRFRTGAAVTLQVDTLPPTWTLPPGAVQGMFRVAQEALSNIARHARANHASVIVSAVAGSLTLTIRDDGIGFDQSTARSGIGTSSMEGRAADLNGTFERISRPGAGTMIRFTVPYETATAREYRRKAMVWFAIAAVLAVVTATRAVFDNGGLVTVVLWLPIASISAVRYLMAFLRLRRLEATA